MRQNAKLLHFGTVSCFCPLRLLIPAFILKSKCCRREAGGIKKSMNEIMVRTIVKKAIRDFKTDPERTIRNLVDMALQFSDSAFQQRFYSVAQRLLSDEKSGYYDLVKNTITKINEQTLLTFSMNLGYNGLYLGAKKIRETAQREGYHIPWTVSLAVGEDALCDRLHALVDQGEALGIHTWHLFSNHGIYECLTLAESHPDSSFAIFCAGNEIDLRLLDYADDIHNIALFIPYDEDADVVCELLQASGMLYGIYHCYTDTNLPALESGELMEDIQQLHPAVAVLMPQFHCQQQLRERAYGWINRARVEQKCRTIPWELYSDTILVDDIISGEGCWIGFDSYGQLNTESGLCREPELNLFRQDLPAILKQAFPLKKEGTQE